MITLRKLESLPERTRGRKLLTLLVEEHEGPYETGLVRMAHALLGESMADAVPGPRARALLRQRLAHFLGIAVADWDLQAPPDGNQRVRRFPFSVWLDDLRSPFNVGSLVRTAEAYGFTSLYTSPHTPAIDHPRAKRSAMGADAHLEIRTLPLQDLKRLWGARPVFALELGGEPIDRFPFPSEGLVLVGGEELGLGPDALSWADGSLGRVSLPLYGRKASLNVGVAFGILAAGWVATQA